LSSRAIWPDVLLTFQLVSGELQFSWLSAFLNFRWYFGIWFLVIFGIIINPRWYRGCVWWKYFNYAL